MTLVTRRHAHGKGRSDSDPAVYLRHIRMPQKISECPKRKKGRMRRSPWEPATPTRLILLKDGLQDVGFAVRSEQPDRVPLDQHAIRQARQPPLQRFLQNRHPGRQRRSGIPFEQQSRSRSVPALPFGPPERSQPARRAVGLSAAARRPATPHRAHRAARRPAPRPRRVRPARSAPAGYGPR